MGLVSQCSFKKSCIYSFQGPVYQYLEFFFLNNMLEQVSLLSNKMRHLRVCKTPWKLRFDEEDNNVRLKIVWDVRIFAMNVQVQAV
jgi:hypothetical protein